MKNKKKISKKRKKYKSITSCEVCETNVKNKCEKFQSITKKPKLKYQETDFESYV